MKKAGIIGSGPVAQALAKGLLANGYNVKLGTRDASKLADWQAQAGEAASVGTFAEAAAHGDLLILAVKGGAAIDALHAAGTQHLSGKTIIDTTNPIADAPPVDGLLQFFTGPNDSLLERLQSQFPNANLVKAFNSVGNAAMVNPSFPGGQPTMFICGNNEAARKEVSDLLTAFGWEVADMGKAAAARAIEPLCTLWCIPGFLSNDWNHAFKLLRG
jgi:predicted dinucleotide-binding enzyme